MTSESDVIHDILLAFGARKDMKIWRNNTGAAKRGKAVVKFGLTGSADIIFVLGPPQPGRFMGVEAKRPGGDYTASGNLRKPGEQSDQQGNFQREIENLGGLYVLADSVDDVRQVLVSLGFPP